MRRDYPFIYSSYAHLRADVDAAQVRIRHAVASTRSEYICGAIVPLPLRRASRLAACNETNAKFGVNVGIIFTFMLGGRGAGAGGAQ